MELPIRKRHLMTEPRESSTPAQIAGCCLAPSEEACSRPPCLCNFGSWTVEEKNALAAQAHADAAAQRMERRVP